MWRKYLSEKFQGQLEKSKDDGFYSGEYVEFDPMGYLRVRCMRCGEIVSERKRAMNGAYVMIPLENYLPVKKILSDGTEANFISCNKCSQFIALADNDEEKRMMAAAQAGWAQEMVNAHRDELVIAAYMEKKKDLAIIHGGIDGVPEQG